MIYCNQDNQWFRFFNKAEIVAKDIELWKCTIFIRHNMNSGVFILFLGNIIYI